MDISAALFLNGKRVFVSSVMLGFFSVLGCANVSSPLMPDCSALRAIYRASLDDFRGIKKGVTIARPGTLADTTQATLVFPQATCFIRDSRGVNYVCRWPADNIDEAEVRFLALRSLVNSCLKEATALETRGNYISYYLVRPGVEEVRMNLRAWNRGVEFVAGKP